MRYIKIYPIINSCLHQSTIEYYVLSGSVEKIILFFDRLTHLFKYSATDSMFFKQSDKTVHHEKSCDGKSTQRLKTNKNKIDSFQYFVSLKKTSCGLKALSMFSTINYFTIFSSTFSVFGSCRER